MSAFFSIVIPLHNKEKFIGETLDSVKIQTYTDFEVIIVDDGSTDGSAKIVRSALDDRIRYQHQQNQGVSAARNAGIEKADGKYIAFLDADDVWDKDFLNEIASLIEQFPEASGFATAYRFKVGSDKYEQPILSKSFPRGWKGIVTDYFGASLQDPLITASSFVVKRNVFDSNEKFKVGHGLSEDLELWARIAMQFKIAFSNISLTTYRKDNNNNSRNNYEIKEDFILLKLLEENVDQSKIFKKSFQKYFAVYALKCALRHQLAGRNNDAKRLYDKFFRLCVSAGAYKLLAVGSLKKLKYKI